MAEFDEFEDFRRRAYSAGCDHPAATVNRTYRNKNVHRRIRKHYTHGRTPHPFDERDSDSDDNTSVTKDIQLLERMAKLKIKERVNQQGFRHIESDNKDEIGRISPESVMTETTSINSCEFKSYTFTSMPPGGRSSPASPCTDNLLIPCKSNVTPHKRSLSCRHRTPRRPRDLDLTPDLPTRRRTYSMPSRNKHQQARIHAQRQLENRDIPHRDDDYICIKTFSTTSKGISSRGSSFKRRSELHTSSSLIVNECLGEEEEFRARAWSGTSQGSSIGSTASSLAPPHYTVIVLGADGVGKSTIIHNFISSECTQDSSFDDEENIAVPVLVDGEEYVLEFVDHSPTLNPEDIPTGDAYLIVFSVAQQESFDDAVDLLFELRKHRVSHNKAVILVANKRDIVRQREVEEEEAKTMAVRYDVKYIEVSTVLNHKVDDLLVGILKQIKLKEISRKKSKKKMSRRCLPEASESQESCLHTCATRGIVGRIFKKHPLFNSCDNLFVL